MHNLTHKFQQLFIPNKLTNFVRNFYLDFLAIFIYFFIFFVFFLRSLSVKTVFALYANRFCRPLRRWTHANDHNWFQTIFAANWTSRPTNWTAKTSIRATLRASTAHLLTWVPQVPESREKAQTHTKAHKDTAKRKRKANANAAETAMKWLEAAGKRMCVATCRVLSSTCWSFSTATAGFDNKAVPA